MSEFNFYNAIRSDYLKELENLFYLNKKQNNYRQIIIDFIEKYGEPRIVKEDKYITIKVDGNYESGCIFAAYGPRLVGVLVYLYLNDDTILVIYIAIDSDYTHDGEFKEMMLFSKMFDELKRIAKQKGTIKKIEFRYKKKQNKLTKIYINK